ncbi:MAG: DUF4212 domain-containing protein, partial [Xanthomonadales bacterium]|nr:DUF4212 domain-containing protein [Xanthomonadales bacterium]
YLEFDLFGSALGNEVATNTYGVTVRHAFASWNRWLAGETWSNFQDVAALPDAVDFIGPTEGSIFVRQAQVRYTSGPWSFSVENKQTVLTPFRGNSNRIVSDDGNLPDFTLRYTHKGDWGHFGIAGLVRHAGSAIDADTMGYGISLSGKYNLGPKDDLRYMLTAGRGISRYIGLAVATDGVLDAGNDIDTVGAVTGYVAWRHAFSPTFRTNVYRRRPDQIHAELPRQCDLDCGAEAGCGHRGYLGRTRTRIRCRRQSVPPALPRQVQLLRGESIMAKAKGSAADYWRANLRVMAILLSIWFAVSFGAGILFVDVLNEIRFFGFKLGFFFAQQGAIAVFVLIIFYYAWRMDKLEREYDVNEE